MNRLAGFELNKERLFAAGLLSLCFQLLDGSCTDDEILVATQTFWILSFNSAVRAEVKASQFYMQGKHHYCCCVCVARAAVIIWHLERSGRRPVTCKSVADCSSVVPSRCH